MVKSTAHIVLLAALALFIALTAVYVILSLAPGGPLSQLRLISDSKSKFSDKDKANMERMLGLDTPVPVRYVAWLTGDDWMGVLNEDWQGEGQGILRGDFGKSWTKHRAVSGMIGERLPNSLLTMFATVMVALALALPIGALAARRSDGPADGWFRLFVASGLAMPSFWVSLLLIILFTNKFHEWGLPNLPPGGSQSLRPPQGGSLLGLIGVSPGSLMDRAIHMLMPVAALSIPLVAGWAHFLRGRMIDARDRALNATSAHEADIPIPHYARMVLVPTAAMALFQLPSLFGIAILSETAFSYPGLSRLFIAALNGNDWPVLQAYLTILVVFTVGAVVASALVQRMGDPRAVVRRSAPNGMSTMELAWDFSTPGPDLAAPDCKSAWRSFSHSWLARIGAASIVVILVAVIIGPLLSPYVQPTSAVGDYAPTNSYPSPGARGAEAEEQDAHDPLVVLMPTAFFAECRNLAPFSRCPDGYHLLGTDRSGRDYLSRLMLGGRRSLYIALTSALLASLLGVALGLAVGRLGGPVDRLVMLVADGLIAIPRLPFLLLVLILIPWRWMPEGSTTALILLFVLLGWMPATRHVRDRAAALKAARAAGAEGGSDRRDENRDIVLVPLVLTSVLGVSTFLLTESAISFLGFGVFPPDTSWGSMLRDVQGKMFDDPFEVILPVIALTLTCVAFNLVGTSLRRALEESTEAAA